MIRPIEFFHLYDKQSKVGEGLAPPAFSCKNMIA